MNEVEDLRRMFEAQRRMDARLAPSFEGIEATLNASRNVKSNVNERRISSWPMRFALSAIAATVIIGVVSWSVTPRPNDGAIHSTAQADLRKLHQACDSLLARIETADPDSMATGALEHEMNWRAPTDVFVPFETFSFSVRTLP